jgi:iron complex outermembrane receptor protein
VNYLLSECKLQLKAYIPSSINEDDFNNNPEKRQAIKQAQATESYDKWMMGAYRHNCPQNGL